MKPESQLRAELGEHVRNTLRPDIQERAVQIAVDLRKALSDQTLGLDKERERLVLGDYMDDFHGTCDEDELLLAVLDGDIKKARNILMQHFEQHAIEEYEEACARIELAEQEERELMNERAAYREPHPIIII